MSSDARRAKHGELPPATGAWQEGDPVGGRHFVDVFADHALLLEAGGTLGGPGAPPVRVAYETWGSLSERKDNVVLLLHALTGDSHVKGPVGAGHSTPGWWEAMVGPGRAIDTDQFFVVVPNVLGGCQGTTGPSSIGPDGVAWGSRFPTVTIRDQVAVEMAAMSALGFERLHGVIGGSMGGMRALEWALCAPTRVERLIVLACGPMATGEQIALSLAQREAILADERFAAGDYYAAAPGEGPWRGMGVARRIGQITYRTRAELRERFGRDPQRGEDPLHGGRFLVEGYLDHHASKLAWRFDANSYVILSRAMDLHDVGRGRGGVEAALATLTMPTTVIGFDSDRLYYLDEQERIARHVPTAHPLIRLSSPFGHDAFLLEAEAVSPYVAEALREHVGPVKSQG